MNINIWIYIVIILVVVLVAFISNEFDKSTKKKNSMMDFSSAMDLTGIPVVTFSNNGHKFNFILDTGANLSVINSIVLEKFVYLENDKVSSLSGMEGNVKEVKFVDINLDFKEHHFKESFQVVNMDAAFRRIKKTSGVTVSGILGSEFFRAHKYVLDFKDLIAYIKK